MEERKYPYNKVGDPYIDELLDRVEEALGFQLFIWQRQYIWTGKTEWVGGRWTGKTTAYILRTLLRFTENDEPLDMICPSTKQGEIFKKDMKDLQKKLDEFGISTRKVWYNKEDRELQKEKKQEKSHSVEIDVSMLYPDITKVFKTIMLSEDDIILKQLKEYGITKGNILRNLGRVQVLCCPPYGEKACMKKRFLVDGDYAFTLIYKTELKNEGQTMTCSIDVEEDA